MSICQICLSTDRNLNEIDEYLFSYHLELCDFDLKIIEDVRYCSECAYLLKKSYNFKHKCQRTNQILTKWRMLPKQEQKPLQDLKNELPPSSLGLSKNINRKTEFVTHNDIDSDQIQTGNTCEQTSNTGNIAYSNKQKTGDIAEPILIQKKRGKRTSTEESDSQLLSTTSTKDSFNENLTNKSLASVKRKSVFVPCSYGSKRKAKNVDCSYEEIDDAETDFHNVLEPKRNDSENIELENIEQNVKIEDNNDENSYMINEIDIQGLKEELFIDENSFDNTENDIEEQEYIPHSEDAYDSKSSDETTDDDDDYKIKKSTENVAKKRSTNKKCEVKRKSIKTMSMKTDKRNKIAKNKLTNNVDIENVEVPDEDKKLDRDLELLLQVSLSDDEEFHAKVDKVLNTLAKSETKNKNIDQIEHPTELNTDNSELNTDNIELKSDKKRRELIANINLNVQKSKRDLKELINVISNKFENQVVKDDSGYVLDKDFIISNLETLHERTFKTIKRFCMVPGPLSPKATKLLAQLQKRSGYDHTDLFVTELLQTPEEMYNKFHESKYSERYLKAKYKCEMCYKCFIQKGMLDYHVDKYHNPTSQKVCLICSKRYTTDKQLSDHIGHHRSIFRCKMCDFITNDRSTILNHARLHQGVKHACKLCEKSFKHATSLAEHMNLAHTTEAVACQFCAKNFYSKFGLRHHTKLKHKDDQISEASAVKCSICDIVFASAEVLKVHEQNSHEKPKSRNVAPYETWQLPQLVCQECGVDIIGYAKLRSHYCQEHPDTPCPTKAEKKHLCHVCGKSFAIITLLRDHQTIHNGSRPFPCEKCPKTFTSRALLKHHMDFHNPPKRQCEHCGKKFHSAANLYTHRRIHTGKKTFICEVCGKAFYFRGALREHIRGVHMHIRRVKKKTAVL